MSASAPVLQFKRGLLSNLPGLRAGEPAFTTDSYDFYVGIDSTTNNNQFLGSSRYWLVNSATGGSGVKLVEGTNYGTNSITIKAPDSLSSDLTYTMPGSDGTNNQVLATNGSGTLSFIDPATNLSIQGDSGTDTVDLLTDTLTFAGTSNEIETAVTDNQVQIGLPDDVTVNTSLTTPTVKVTNVQANDGTTAITITDSTGAVSLSQNLTVTGNLYVNGSTTQVNTATTTIEDQLLDLGMVDGAVPTSDLNKDIGILLNYYTSSAKKAAVYWDDSASRIVVSSDVSESSGVLTNSTAGALEVGSLYVNDCAGNTQVINCSGSERTLENITVDGGSF